MMNTGKRKISYYESIHAQVATLPYEDSSLRAVIILPKNKSIKAFQNAFDHS